MKKISRILGIIVLTAAFAFFQGFSIGGIMPNLLFPVLVFIALREDFLVTLAASAASLLVVKSGPFMDFPTSLLFLFVLGISLFKATLPWQEAVLYFLSIFLGTLLLYAVAEPALILSSFFLQEVFVALAGGAAIFAIFSRAWQNEATKY